MLRCRCAVAAPLPAAQRRARAPRVPPRAWRTSSITSSSSSSSSSSSGRRRRHSAAAAAGGDGPTTAAAAGDGAGPTTAGAAAAQPAAGASSRYNWTFDLSQPAKQDPKVQEIPLALIRRPLGRTRSNDQAKVVALMASIDAIGLQEPIDVLLVDGVYYGFSGCHRFEAHARLGRETIRARVRRATREVLRMHLM
ncbi:hypothetical protein HT031_006181 [Scenedesmus sp. PABB004]|nr:hypothetical protein HT031_006181 [Scenedesmus sp. PABB004]